jgi:hypothetical protein
MKTEILKPISSPDQPSSINEMYLHALKMIGTWVTISEWALKFSELYPEQLEKAETQAAGQKQDTTGLREIAARISSQTSRGAFGGKIEIDLSERPRRVRWISDDYAMEHEIIEIEEDLEPLRRGQKIKLHREAFTSKERYRQDEFEEIIRQLNFYFATDFELDHACALLNRTNPGNHHPENFQILTKSHNRKKNDSNWNRFLLNEQIEYIQSAVNLQKTIAVKLNIDFQEELLHLLIERLRKIF